MSVGDVVEVRGMRYEVVAVDSDGDPTLVRVEPRTLGYLCPL